MVLDFDAADAALPFSARLARDNGWSHGYAAQVIAEYRKFCFLAVHAGHPVTPSDQVDQVWHLHLTHSRHYWETLCRDTLARPLHHGPTHGGAAEARKFDAWYEATLNSYRRHFGEPPKGVWPVAAERFHERNDFVRINRRHVVTLDRTAIARGVSASLAVAGVLAAAHAVAQADGGAGGAPEIGFVVALSAVLIGGFIVAVAGSRRRKPRGAGKRRANDAAAAGGVAAGGPSAKSGGGRADDAAGDGGAGCGGGGASGCGGGGCGGGGWTTNTKDQM